MRAFPLQPIADAIYYKNQDVIKLLEEYGAKPPVCTSIPLFPLLIIVAFFLTFY